MSMGKATYEDITNVYEEMFDAFKRIKKNSDLAIMCVDNKYVLVNTKDNKFNVIKEYKTVKEFLK